MEVDKSKTRGYRKTKANVLAHQGNYHDPQSTVYSIDPRNPGGELEKMSDNPRYGEEDYLMESVHKKEGTFDGEVYYSPSMPKGKKDDWPYEYDKDLTREFRGIHGLGNDELKTLQVKMIDMGLLEPGEADGYMGPKTRGGARRYLINTQPSAWEAIKNSELNIFNKD